jgi:oxygen-dependent protoporphyrinogen oxidase
VNARVVIVGAGVSGLTAAYYLGRLGIRTLLIEKSSRPGGLVRTDQVEGCRLEAGPDSYLSAKPSVTELAAELGQLKDQIIPSNDAVRKVFIARAGKLLPLPDGMSMMVPGKLLPALGSELFTTGTKLRLIRERFTPPRERAGDPSVGELIGDHFGQELLDCLAEPLLAGVYGGCAARLSARSVIPRFVAYEQRYGSLIKGVQQDRKPGSGGSLFQSFKDGMQSLTDALQSAIGSSSEFLQGEALAVETTATGWQVRLSDRSIEAEQLVLAAPAHACARLIEGTIPALALELSAIPYSSAILVTLLYDAAEIGHPLDGFGFLVPPRERATIAAATWINRKFPGRIAAGITAIRVFIVGEEAIQLAGACDRDLIARVTIDLERLMGVAANPRTALVNRWPESMPQYIVGHQERRRRIREINAQWPSLHLIGNAYDGVGIPDCVRLAKAAAARIAQITSPSGTI